MTTKQIELKEKETLENKVEEEQIEREKFVHEEDEEEEVEEEEEEEEEVPSKPKPKSKEKIDQRFQVKTRSNTNNTKKNSSLYEFSKENVEKFGKVLFNFDECMDKVKRKAVIEEQIKNKRREIKTLNNELEKHNAFLKSYQQDQGAVKIILEKKINKK